MLKLLVADDEKYDRESIIAMLSGEFSGELEISEAKNGREAIEISEKNRPEIIIMDIKMPGINGIKAIQEIRKFLPNSYFIILTAYDYFDFAVEAVKNNVKEYILKPFSRTELVEKINDAVHFVKSEKKKRLDEIENQEKLYSFMHIVENELSYAIISDSLSTVDFITYLRYLDVTFSVGCAIVVKLLQLDDANGGPGVNKIKIGEFIKEYISRKYPNIASFRFTRELVYFVQLQEDGEENNRTSMINLVMDLRREVKRFSSVECKIGIGNCYSGIETLSRSYLEALQALAYEPEQGNVIHIKDVRGNMGGKRSGNGNEREHDRDRSANNDREKIALFRAVESYIRDNITEELDLESTASKFNLSPFYFSRTFKEILGSNFSDYVNIVRINTAKELLKNDAVSIKEICYSVGYSDPNYFSKVFRKYEGISPTEFKIKNLD